MSSNTILSLVPSLTELLYDLGLGSRVSGRTRFCIHPAEKVTSAEIIGGTKNPSLEKIRSLNPGLIIANREENRKEDVEVLQQEFDLLLTDIKTIEDAFQAIDGIGNRCGAERDAANLIREIRIELEDTPKLPERSAAYLIWKKPWMSVGRDTYIHSVMEHWSLRNVFAEKTRYPETSLSELAVLKPDLILLSSEPYPFKQQHLEEVASICRSSEIRLVNGEWFSWYGSRMLPAFRELNHFFAGGVR
ncbi:MAG: hypothetical protein EA360_02795 [Balneolaceae bacterium]|nr:MAG: hypothetical protein EA360_02795 [Balneolaceae bacterium]